MKLMNFEQALTELQGLTKFGINLGLQRITRLLALLGNPQESLRPIHIGGTNGKGSTAAILTAILSKAGYRVGAYSSPHLESYTERLTINGLSIAEEDFALYFSRVLSKYEQVKQEMGDAPTEFEVLTALAFLYFAEQQVDILILEVGLGGDIDSTNVIKDPLLSIITNVTLDHCDYLGGTPRAIAEKKSGIIKRGRPVITASNDENVLEVLRNTAIANQAQLHEVYGECSWSLVSETISGQYFNLFTPVKERQAVFLSLRGTHQLVNAATALLALEVLSEEGWQISEKAIEQGLTAVSWPGRLELVREQPQVFLDGAHNLAGLEALALWLRGKRLQVDKVVLVIGMLDDKDHAGVSLLEPLVDTIIITRPPSPRAARWDSLASYFSQDDKEIHMLEEPQEAIDKAMSLAKPQDLIMVTGSLFLIGDVRRYLRT